MTSHRARLAAAALPLALAATALITAPSASAGEAGAEACTHPSWSNKDDGWGGLNKTSGTAPLRTGPNEGCGVVANVNTSQVLYYHCYTFNSSGNSWTHVRIKGTQTQGWIWDEHLTFHGSTVGC
ncbi:SH3 domain-containing protein [Streptomyces sp. NPDC049881]|uniref:SH3 domain-containing protein n=1 Tax=unclassified Streptomyces TaxID=2593676 RepID=UPI00342AE621